jgi:hypothetical protein
MDVVKFSEYKSTGTLVEVKYLYSLFGPVIYM